MRFVARPPSAPLDAFVALLWHAERADAPALEWVLPSGRPQLLVQRSKDHTGWTDRSGHHGVSGAAVGGPFLQPVGVAGPDQQHVAGALFHAGGVAALLDVPLRAMAGTYVDVTTLWGGEAARWVDGVRAARTAEAALDALDAALQGLVRRRSRRSALTQACAALARGDRVRDVAADLGASQRRFSRTFNDETGLTPKQYTRLSRFQRAVAALRSAGAGDLAEVALRCGYYDQAHLNHEFAAFSGLTPTAYLARQGPYTNHVSE